VTAAGVPDLPAEVRGLLDRALDEHAGRPAAVDRLRAVRGRLDEPLRVALAGRVKAGKSTLLNALVGERLAPTDAGECTRVVTWYQRGPLPRVVLHAADGTRHPLPVRREHGELRLDLADTPADSVDRLVVEWPATGLAPATLIDTPGIASLSVDASARTQALLDAGDQLSGADAVVFLTRRFQPGDLAFLAAVQESCGGSPATTLTVFSRADDAGGGRLDALLAAQQLAAEAAELPAVRALSATVLPVAGLLALAGRTLRHADFVAVRALARADRADTEPLLLTADRFLRPEAPGGLPLPVRTSLLERLGLFGVRLAVALVRTGVDDAPALAEELVTRSGLPELQRLLAAQFTRRSDQLKAGTALALLERLLAGLPPSADGVLERDVERVRAGARDLAELELLTRTRAADGPFPRDQREEAERLLGAHGTDAATRLGLPPDAAVADLRTAALDVLRRARARAADPAARRPESDAAEELARAAEAVLAGLPDSGGATASDGR
jgi:hypothetical protein